ncbi:hypothetical protein ACFWP3_11985 [Streptomyces sp. NPDC058525]|uniref:hypothetical protein n=1 Tax=unclassified Streptomyces TaxID=2593676 RepID=UPI00366A3214
MRLRRESIDLPEDRGCLQWVLGVPLALLYAPAVYFCVLLLIAEADPGDGRMRADMRSGAHAVYFICLLGLLVCLLPVYRRTMNRWWYALPALLSAVAWIRIATL